MDAGKRLERGGADCVLICANTMHISAPQLEQAVKIPLLHIADVAGKAIVESGPSRVGFLGTAFTMEKLFYTDRLREKFGLDVLLPDKADRATTHRIIFDELVRGVSRPNPGRPSAKSFSGSSIAVLKPSSSAAPN